MQTSYRLFPSFKKHVLRALRSFAKFKDKIALWLEEVGAGMASDSCINVSLMKVKVANAMPSDIVRGLRQHRQQAVRFFEKINDKIALGIEEAGPGTIDDSHHDCSLSAGPAAESARRHV